MTTRTIRRDTYTKRLIVVSSVDGRITLKRPACSQIISEVVQDVLNQMQPGDRIRVDVTLPN